jgi:hypothetical protein
MNLQIKSHLKIEDELNLIKEYLLDESSFWTNVQEPSSRNRDVRILAELAIISHNRFDNIHIKSASVVNVFYRILDGAWRDEGSYEDILKSSKFLQNQLQPSASFDDCRWLLSLILAESAFHIKNKNFSTANDILKKAEGVRLLAHEYGQLYTNIVKANFVRISIAKYIEPFNEASSQMILAAQECLSMANSMPKNYKFENQFAFEEVAYVYGMLREIYKWLRSEEEVNLNSLGSTFKDLLMSIK